MKLLESIQKHRDFHTSMVSSFTSDLSAYEDLLLYRIEQSGTYNNILLVDQRMYREEMASLMDMQGCQIRKTFHAGQRYSLFPIAVQGAFHPKLYLFLGRKKARLYLGSANVSAAGLGRNQELMFELESGETDSAERVLIRKAFNFMRGFLVDQYGDTQLLHEQLDFVRRESPWLFDEQQEQALQSLDDGSVAALLLSNSEQSTLTQLFELIGDDTIKNLTVISPYWDESLSTLQALQDRLQPKQTRVLIQPGRTELPVHAIEQLGFETRLYQANADDKAGFMHAKMILLSSSNHDHLICGSANCTMAALGSAGKMAVNAEASIYRRLPAGTVIKSLGLKNALQPERLLNPAELPDTKAANGSSHKQKCSAKAARYPGTIELESGRIRWFPATGVPPNGATAELYDWSFALVAEIAVMDGAYFPLPASTAEQDLMLVRFRLADGELTEPAFIHHKQMLRKGRIKSGNSLMRAIYEKFDAADSPIGLELMELVQRIEAENRTQDGRSPASSHAVRTRRDDDGESEGEVIPPDEFVRVREDDGRIGSVALASSGMLPIRDLLNHYFHKQQSSKPVDQSGGVDDAHIYDEEAAAESQDSESMIAALDVTEEEAQRTREYITNQRAMIIKATENFSSELKQRCMTGEFIHAVDLLKLRLLIEIVLSAASTNAKGGPIIRTLPEFSKDQDSLCHIIGKLLFAFFSGANTPVDAVSIPKGLEGYPIDYLETWVCCKWTVQQLCKLAASTESLQMLLPRLMKLAALISKKTDVCSNNEHVKMVKKSDSQMNDRYGKLIAENVGGQALVIELF